MALGSGFPIPSIGKRQIAAGAWRSAEDAGWYSWLRYCCLELLDRELLVEFQQEDKLEKLELFDGGFQPYHPPFRTLYYYYHHYHYHNHHIYIYTYIHIIIICSTRASNRIIPPSEGSSPVGQAKHVCRYVCMYIYIYIYYVNRYNNIYIYIYIYRLLWYNILYDLWWYDTIHWYAWLSSCMQHRGRRSCVKVIQNLRSVDNTNLRSVDNSK